MSAKLQKTVIINRAVPGSGKTTISNCVVSYLVERGASVSIHSTDEFFMDEQGGYVFEIEKLYSNHQQNLSKFIKNLEAKCDAVICDNINLSPWETEPYTSAARKYDYRVLFLNFYPRELEKHIQSQQVTEEKPDAHGVPTEILVRFIQEFNDYNSLLDASNPIDPLIHKHFTWDNVANARVETTRTCPHFDVDEIVTIMPDEYHRVKQTIGRIIYKKIRTETL
jgi:hypothetical protein